MAKENYTVEISKEIWTMLQKEAKKNFRTPQLQLEFMLNNIINKKQTKEEAIEVLAPFLKDPPPPPSRQDFERQTAIERKKRLEEERIRELQELEEDSIS